MAKAFARLDDILGYVDGTYALNLIIIFCGTGVPGERDISTTSATVNGSDTASQIRTKISDAIVAEANRLGYTVTAGEISLPYFEKGV